MEHQVYFSLNSFADAVCMRACVIFSIFIRYLIIEYCVEFWWRWILLYFILCNNKIQKNNAVIAVITIILYFSLKKMLSFKCCFSHLPVYYARSFSLVFSHNSISQRLFAYSRYNTLILVTHSKSSIRAHCVWVNRSHFESEKLLISKCVKFKQLCVLLILLRG